MLDPNDVDVFRIAAMLLLRKEIEADPRTERERWADASWFGKRIFSPWPRPAKVLGPAGTAMYAAERKEAETIKAAKAKDALDAKLGRAIVGVRDGFEKRCQKCQTELRTLIGVEIEIDLISPARKWRPLDFVGNAQLVSICSICRRAPSAQ